MRFKFRNSHRCTSFPPINSQTGTNKTHGQHAEYVEWLSCLLLNQLCNYLKDVLIVACSTLNISQSCSSSPSKIDWINQSELRVNRRPANQWCVWERVYVCLAGGVPVSMCATSARKGKYIRLTAGFVQKAYWAFCLCLGSNKHKVYLNKDLKPVSTAEYNRCKQPVSPCYHSHIPAENLLIFSFFVVVVVMVFRISCRQNKRLLIKSPV